MCQTLIYTDRKTDFSHCTRLCGLASIAQLSNYLPKIAQSKQNSKGELLNNQVAIHYYKTVFEVYFSESDNTLKLVINNA